MSMFYIIIGGFNIKMTYTIMPLRDYVNERVNRLVEPVIETLLKQTVRKNQFAENNWISPSPDVVNNVQFPAQTDRFAS